KRRFPLSPPPPTSSVSVLDSRLSALSARFPVLSSLFFVLCSLLSIAQHCKTINDTARLQVDCASKTHYTQNQRHLQDWLLNDRFAANARLLRQSWLLHIGQGPCQPPSAGIDSACYAVRFRSILTPE